MSDIFNKIDKSLLIPENQKMDQLIARFIVLDSRLNEINGLSLIERANLLGISKEHLKKLLTLDVNKPHGQGTIKEYNRYIDKINKLIHRLDKNSNLKYLYQIKILLKKCYYLLGKKEYNSSLLVKIEKNLLNINNYYDYYNKLLCVLKDIFIIKFHKLKKLVYSDKEYFGNDITLDDFNKVLKNYCNDEDFIFNDKKDFIQKYIHQHLEKQLKNKNIIKLLNSKLIESELINES